MAPRQVAAGDNLNVMARRPGFPHRLLLAARNVLLVIALVLLSGVLVQAIVERGERERYPPPGQLVDVGDGRHIHLRTWGMENDGPTIILDASGSYFSSAYAWYGQMLGTDYRVVAYDRPGMGWSVGRREPRDARSSAEALTVALERAGIGPPYVVVGHSFGAFSARVFADMHRDDVVALILLDTSHPDQGGGPYYGIPYRRLALIAHTGLYVLLPLPPAMPSLPEGEAERANTVSRWTTHLDATAEELEAFDQSAEQVRQAGSFGDTPLLVISALGSAGHLGLQADLTRLSSRSEFVHLDHVYHASMLLDREHAADTVAEIGRFLQRSEPLP